MFQSPLSSISSAVHQGMYESEFFSAYRFTYEISPVFILMEEVVLRKMHTIIGWQEEDGDGIFCPGNKLKAQKMHEALILCFEKMENETFQPLVFH